MQRDAVPGDALHVRHPGIVIHGRVVVLVLLDDGEDAGRRLASRGAGRDRRAQDPAVGIVERDLLALDRHDRHDRLAGLARRRRLGGCRARLFRRGAGGQRCQCGHRRERHNCGRPPTPHRHGGLRRRQSIFHAMPRLKCLSALASINDQIAIFGLRNRSHHRFRFRQYSVRSGDETLIYDGPGGRKGGPRPGLAWSWPARCGRMSALGGGGRDVTRNHRELRQAAGTLAINSPDSASEDEQVSSSLSQIAAVVAGLALLVTGFVVFSKSATRSLAKKPGGLGVAGRACGRPDLQSPAISDREPLCAGLHITLQPNQMVLISITFL